MLYDVRWWWWWWWYCTFFHVTKTFGHIAYGISWYKRERFEMYKYKNCSTSLSLLSSDELNTSLSKSSNVAALRITERICRVEDIQQTLNNVPRNQFIFFQNKGSHSDHRISVFWLKKYSGHFPSNLSLVYNHRDSIIRIAMAISVNSVNKFFPHWPNFARRSLEIKWKSAGPPSYRT